MNYGRHAFGSLLPLSERHVLGQASATRCSRPIADLPGIAVLLINSTIPVDTHLSINPGEPKVYTSYTISTASPPSMTFIHRTYGKTSTLDLTLPPPTSLQH
ncbi:hypothetical protein PtA15_10A286 [Puccinia triticina]|uniref:Uncharacterized protein n=1 Tax=Puccinia triticina TaxID=208348 RepID=A0ABY7CYJ5_9BASI|nr:uncharacterized protein PtA15_10A286 [Puccinia triticina]WAQ88865.1 hypothetical protein PtA15_10A286 [Puccinia triticina]